jgi:hypothetical protein
VRRDTGSFGAWSGMANPLALWCGDGKATGGCKTSVRRPESEWLANI